MKWRRFLRCLVLALPFSAFFNGAICAQVPFYQGRTITVTVSSDGGDTSEDASIIIADRLWRLPAS